VNRGWWWKTRWLRRVAYVLLAGLASVACWHFFRHYQVTTKLQQAEAALDRSDPGWRLADIEAARAVVPDEQNSARCVVRAVQLLPKDWPPKDLADALAHLDPPSHLDPTLRERLAAELDAVRPAVEEARKLADMPQGRYSIHYPRNPLNTLLDEQQRARCVFALLDYDAKRLDEDERPDEALRSCRAGLNAARSLGDEPLAITQLIRIAGVAIACKEVERALAQGEPDPAALADFQRLLLEEDAFPGMELAIRGERGMQQELFDALESGDVSVNELADGHGGPDLWERLFGWNMRDNFRDEHPLMLRMMTRRLEITRLPPDQQEAAERALDAEVRNLPPVAILTKLFAPALSKVSDAYRRKLAYERSLLVALAAERYRRQNGRWPEAAEDLTPTFLEQIPLDPYDGEPIRYRRLDDGAVAYSVGRDRQDDGGTFDDAQPTRPGTDLGFRLWNPVKRRRPAPPPTIPPE
jgi:hypothetical protein